MKIFLHVGPHKTGTTSIQLFAKKHFGSDEPQPIWYPTGDALGTGKAGHGGLADPFSRRPHLRNPELGYPRLGNILDRAFSNGTDTLLISSENFSLCSTEDLSAIAANLGRDNVTLVFTASPLSKRLVSAWQAQVLFKGTRPIEEAKFLLRDDPGFQPDYFSRIVRAIKPKRCTLIVSDPDQPDEQLLRDFFAVCELPWPDRVAQQDTVKRNTALDYYAAEMMIAMNRLFKDATKDDNPFSQDYLAIRQKLNALVRSPEWRAAFPSIPLRIPAAVNASLTPIAAEMRADIEQLMTSGKLSIVGNLDVVFQGLEDTTAAEASVD